MKEIAIIGPTASGKSNLALEIATKHNANILSLDSLSIYKEIDIVSAKPSKKELALVPHYGIDVIYPDEHFSVERFIHIYKEAKRATEKAGKNLIIVGGSSFYLKALIDGISPLPKIDKEISRRVKKLMHSLQDAYNYLKDKDPLLAQRISPQDKYRIEKALLIIFATNLPPTKYFHMHPPQKITSCKIFAIEIAKEDLIERIKRRTKKMIDLGLIDEICYLEKKYTRSPAPMKAIGIKETLDYLDGKIASIDELASMISKHTAQLAKRQRTFNKTQFPNKVLLPIKELKDVITQELAD